MIVTPTNSLIGRFGNHIFQINCGLQMSALSKQEFKSNKFEYWDIFKNTGFYDDVAIQADCFVTSDLLKINDRQKICDILDEYKNKKAELQFQLVDLFFIIHTLDTYKLFEFQPHILSKVYIPDNTVGIHIRQGDRIIYTPPNDYFIKAIEYILKRENNLNFIIFTDNKQSECYINTKNFLITNNLSHIESDENIIADFVNMSHCKYLISSLSTFSICAGFCGIPKGIIHSQYCINLSIKLGGDVFWKPFMDSGNENYKLYTII